MDKVESSLSLKFNTAVEQVQQQELYSEVHGPEPEIITVEIDVGYEPVVEVELD